MRTKKFIVGLIASIALATVSVFGGISAAGASGTSTECKPAKVICRE